MGLLGHVSRSETQSTTTELAHPKEPLLLYVQGGGGSGGYCWSAGLQGTDVADAAVQGEEATAAPLQLSQ